MTCVSNQVGGDLVGNARWLGVLTRDLLDRGRRPPGRRPARRPLDRRLHVRVPDRGRLRPPVPRGDRHERRAAAAAARLPRPARHPRPLRLRRLDQVADRARGHDLRRLRPVLGAPGLCRAGAHQDDGPHRHAPQPRAGGGGRGRRRRRGLGADPGHRAGRGRASTTAPSSRPSSPTSWPPTRGASGATTGTPRPAATTSPSGPSTAPVRPQTEERAETLPDGASGWMSLAVTVTDRDAVRPPGGYAPNQRTTPPQEETHARTKGLRTIAALFVAGRSSPRRRARRRRRRRQRRHDRAVRRQRHRSTRIPATAAIRPTRPRPATPTRLADAVEAGEDEGTLARHDRRPGRPPRRRTTRC